MVAVAEVTIISVYVMLCYEVSSRTAYHTLLASAPLIRNVTELPLVVVLVPHRRSLGRLGISVLRLLLLYEASHPRLRVWTALLQLQLPVLRNVQPLDGNGGVADGLPLCQTHIWVSMVFGSKYNKQIS